LAFSSTLIYHLIHLPGSPGAISAQLQGISLLVGSMLAERIEDILPIYMSVDVTVDARGDVLPYICEFDRPVRVGMGWQSGIAHQDFDHLIDYPIG
jgi:hypothetical protein